MSSQTDKTSLTDSLSGSLRKKEVVQAEQEPARVEKESAQAEQESTHAGKGEVYIEEVQQHEVR